MNRNILSLCAGFVAIASTIFTAPVSAQKVNRGEEIEKINSYWGGVIDNTRANFPRFNKDRETFYRFDEKKLIELKTDFFYKMRIGNFEPSITQKIIKEAETNYTNLYQKFLDIKKNYPSSVEEYAHKKLLTTNPCDSTGCTNIDFDQGTFSGWYGYYATKDDDADTSACLRSTISAITGGALGAVTLACNDPTTALYNGLTNDYQLSITSGGYDNIITSIPRVSPWATGGHSVMLGDSTWVGFGCAIIEKTFFVTPSTANLTYQYAVFLQNPTGHCFGNQPSFLVAALDENGDTIPTCGTYNVTSGYGTSDFDSTTYGGEKLYYRNWTIVNVPLKNYIGKCVTIVFEVKDCGQGGHFGYAYVDASCSPLLPITSSPNLCGQDSISLTAPPGAATYLWTDSMGIHAIRSGDSTTQTIWVDSAGTYRVIITPVTGATCADTLSITIGREPGPPPLPSFTTNIVCSGTPTLFTNTSTPLDSATYFYWDFYNIGIYNDTNVVNPVWTYAAPGVYYVKLHEVYNGCGTDTLIKVTVDTTVNAGFIAQNACVNSTVNFSNSTTGGTSYSWNYGNPSSGTSDTCTVCINGSHTYADSGTYTVTLIAKNGGPCPDTVRVPVHIVDPPVIKGHDTICPGGSDTLVASGGNTYLWANNGSTSDTLIVAPATVKIFTVTIDGVCTSTYTVSPVTPLAVITPLLDSVCSGATDTLKGNGGTSYRWSNGQRSTTIAVNPTGVTTYTLYAYIGTCVDSTTFTVNLVKQVADTVHLSQDSICQGTSTSLYVYPVAGGSSTYSWSTGASGTTILVTPDSTTTYYVLAKGACNTDSVAHIVHVIPLPKPVITGNLTACKGFNDTVFISGATTYLWSNGSTSTRLIIPDLTTDSTLTVIAYNGACVGYDTVMVKYKTPPNVTSIPGIECAGSCTTITVLASGTGPYTYSWETNGATTDTTTVCPDSNTVYYVDVTNGCKAPRAKVLVNVYPIKLTACCDTTLNVVNNGITITGDTAILTANQALSYTWSPPYGLNNTTSQTVIATPTVTTSYTVTGKDANGCLDYRVLTVTVDYPCFNFTVPNVFTPNFTGNSLNREFYIDTKNIDAWSIAIYDRWGKEMFTTSNQYQYWQGTTEGGSSASDGVYYYIIKGTCQGTNYTKTGYVQLIR